MQDLTHYIDGAHVAGTSGRFSEVFNPATGEIQARCPLASAEEMAQAVAVAQAAQPAWGATNPQRRARVMMEFVRLLNRDMDKLAEALSREHGKTLPDAKGDVQRGLEVVEYCIGAPELLKGEFTDSAGPGIDMYSMRQPLGVCAGITPFNFPAMIPMWMFAPALACGNAFILKPSERDPSVPLMLAELMEEAGLPKGLLQVVNGDKVAVDAIIDDPVIQSIGFVGSTPIAEYIYGRGCSNGKRVQCFGGAKNHMIVMPDADMDQAADALIGAGYGAAGERCMAISVAVPVGDETADRLIEKLVPRIEKLKVGPYTAGTTWITARRDGGGQGPHPRAGRERNFPGRSTGCRWAGLPAAGLRGRVLRRPAPLRPRDAGDGHLPAGDLRPGPDDRARGLLRGGAQARDGSRDGQRHRDLHPRRRRGARFCQQNQCRHGRHQRADPGAAGLSHLWRVEEIRFGDLNQHGPDAFKFYTRTKTVTSRWPSGIKEGGEFNFKAMD